MKYIYTLALRSGMPPPDGELQASITDGSVTHFAVLTPDPAAVPAGAEKPTGDDAQYADWKTNYPPKEQPSPPAPVDLQEYVSPTPLPRAMRDDPFFVHQLEKAMEPSPTGPAIPVCNCGAEEMPFRLRDSGPGGIHTRVEGEVCDPVQFIANPPAPTAAAIPAAPVGFITTILPKPGQWYLWRATSNHPWSMPQQWISLRDGYSGCEYIILPALPAAAPQPDAREAFEKWLAKLSPKTNLSRVPGGPFEGRYDDPYADSAYRGFLAGASWQKGGVADGKAGV